MRTKIWTFGTSWKEGDCGLSLNYSDRKEKLLNYVRQDNRSVIWVMICLILHILQCEEGTLARQRLRVSYSSKKFLGYKKMMKIKWRLHAHVGFTKE